MIEGRAAHRLRAFARSCEMPGPTSNSGPLIEFCDVVYRAAGGASVLAGLNLQIKKGELVVLLGRSGSGKTTALKLINRLLEPTTGEINYPFVLKTIHDVGYHDPIGMEMSPRSDPANAFAAIRQVDAQARTLEAKA